MSTSAGSRLPYMVFVLAKVIDPQPFNTCGPSEDPLCRDGRLRQEMKGLCECPEALGIFHMDLKNICKFWSLIKTHHLLVCNIINMMPYNGCSQMLHISLKTEKYFIAHPDACCALLALRSSQLMTGEPRPVQRAPVTWREWGLCSWWTVRGVWVLVSNSVNEQEG